MKKKIHVKRAFYALTASLLFASCQKNDLNDAAALSTENTIAVAASAAVVSSANASGTAAASTDSVYLLQSCKRGEKREMVSETALPATVSSYLSANYAGAIFHKAFSLKKSAPAVTGYVVVIYFNDKPVGLQFDSAGTFVKVLEQREKRDLDGAGHHRGGRFEHRDGKQRDTIAISSLPASVTSYFAANHAADTLVKAFRSKDSSLVVLSRNNGVFATVFNAANTFVKREQLPSKTGRHQNIELSQLPSVAAAYLAQTYPNYVFKTAFSFSQNGTLKGYVVFIDANNTKYAVEFDATGNFVRAKTIQ